ncbi:MAG TPA: nucleotidyltransferase family protein [Thermoanaerobaculia bacterium]
MDFIHMPPIAARLREPLRAALRGERAVWPDPLDDGELRALREHGVVPLVYAAARLPQLQREALGAAATEGLRLRDLRSLLELLEDAGVAPLIVKGSALAYDLYERPELRPRGDTDLLIADADRERVRALLAAQGFDERLTSGDDHGVRQTTFVRRDRFGFEHAYDIHHAITNSAVFADALRYEDLVARARPLPAIAERARGLAYPDALLLACIHRVAHHHDSDRLIWLVDIALLWQAMSAAEQAEFWRRAAAARVVAVCERSLELTAEWTGLRFTPAREVLGTIDEQEPSRVFLDRGASYARITATNLRALPLRQRLQRLRQLAFPPRAYMRQQFGRRPLAAMYLVRALRGMARLFRRVGT